MIPSSFEYSAPSTLDEALKMLNNLGDEAKILAGGHSLIPMMKLRFAEPEHLIDINNIPGLSYVKEDGEYMTIGAMTREVELEESDIVAAKYPIFLDASKLIADPQVRNWGTIGGNLAHGDAANDHPAVMIALDAEVEITGQNESRWVSINEFFNFSSPASDKYNFSRSCSQEDITLAIRICSSYGHTETLKSLS